MSTGDALFIAFVFALFFIFQGEPDLWDKWHDQAMGVQCIKQAIKP